MKGPAKHPEIDDDFLDEEEITILTPEPPIERRYPKIKQRTKQATTPTFKQPI